MRPDPRHPTRRGAAIATAAAMALGAAACAGEEPVVTDGGTPPEDVLESPLVEQTPADEG